MKECFLVLVIPPKCIIESSYIIDWVYLATKGTLGSYLMCNFSEICLLAEVCLFLRLEI